MANPKKISFKVTLVVVLLLVAGGIIFIPYFFNDEFYYVNITYEGGGVEVTSSPYDLFERHVSRVTDVAATFCNRGSIQCDLSVESESTKELFSLGAGQEYGMIFPKKEHIQIIFCEAETNIIIQ